MNDKLEQAGVKIKVKRATPVKGIPSYYDPLENQFKQVQEYHEKLMEEKEESYKTLQYVSNVKLIPAVPYFPSDVYNKLTTGNDVSTDLGIKSSAKNITDQALKGIYSSNFIADKSIDTYFNTRLDPKVGMTKHQRNKSKKQDKQDMSCYIADESSKNVGAGEFMKSRTKSKSLGSLHSLEQFSSIDITNRSQSGELSMQSLNKSPSPLLEMSTATALSTANGLSNVRVKNRGDSVFTDYSGLSEKERLEKSLKEAKRGNKEILFEHFMKNSEQ